MKKTSILILCVLCFIAGRLSISKPRSAALGVLEAPIERKNKIADAVPTATNCLSPRASSGHSINAEQLKQKINLKLLLKEAEKLSRSGNVQNIERTIDLFSQVLAEDPKNLAAVRDYANFLLLQQNPDSAFPLLKKCLELSPTDESCSGNLATYFSMKNDIDGLDQASENCLSLNPNNMACLSNRGNYYLQIKDFQDALADFEKMAELDHSSTVHFNMSYIHHSLGVSYEGLGNLTMARESFDSACREGDSYSCTLAQEL